MLQGKNNIKDNEVLSTRAVREKIGHAVAQAVSGWFTTAAARIRIRAGMWCLLWTKWHWGRFFPPSTSGFPCDP
jgi:hypothetical protein